jgi:hypothetical protein
MAGCTSHIYCFLWQAALEPKGRQLLLLLLLLLLPLLALTTNSHPCYTVHLHGSCFCRAHCSFWGSFLLFRITRCCCCCCILLHLLPFLLLLLLLLHRWLLHPGLSLEHTQQLLGALRNHPQQPCTSSLQRHVWQIPPGVHTL